MFPYPYNQDSRSCFCLCRNMGNPGCCTPHILRTSFFSFLVDSLNSKTDSGAINATSIRQYNLPVSAPPIRMAESTAKHIAKPKSIGDLIFIFIILKLEFVSVGESDSRKPYSINTPVVYLSLSSSYSFRIVGGLCPKLAAHFFRSLPRPPSFQRPIIPRASRQTANVSCGIFARGITFLLRSAQI